MSLTILSVAYPLAPVGPGAVGGAEQVLALLDRALCAAAHRSLVIACAGSTCAGQLLPTTPPPPPFDEEVRRRAQAGHRAAIAAALRRFPVDLVHLHGVDFPEYLPEPGVPTLATLHLPPSWYPREVFFPRRPRPGLHLHCVSPSQRAACPAGAALLPEIENGVPLDELPLRRRKRAFALALGRICPEKGFHLALDAARAAGAPLLLAGAVFPYEAHERYFRAKVAPRLDAHRRYLGPIAGPRRRRLLGAARCLLAPSLAPETSSLVAMEALACGTPVIAFPSGALADIVEDGRTGFLVRGVEEMARAIARAGEISPDDCRAAAEARFCARRSAARYLALYESLAAGARAAA